MPFDLCYGLPCRLYLFPSARLQLRVRDGVRTFHTLSRVFRCLLLYMTRFASVHRPFHMSVSHGISSWTATGDDQDTFQSRRELISVSPSSGLSPTTGMGYASAGGGANGFLGSYGQLGSGSGMVMPYGGSLPIPHYSPMIPPTPLTRQSPPPPPPPTVTSCSWSWPNVDC